MPERPTPEQLERWRWLAHNDDVGDFAALLAWAAALETERDRLQGWQETLHALETRNRELQAELETLRQERNRARVEAGREAGRLREACGLALTNLRRWRDEKPELWDQMIDPEMSSVWDALRAALAGERGEE
jgi:predicted nuclease with TOPRIM domain